MNDTAPPIPDYSICITQYNEGERVRASLDSILRQIDGRFEIVLVDNLSSDGSELILQSYAKEGKIRLFQKKGSRGVGRNLAFESAKGKTIISGIDMDDLLLPGRLPLLLDFYQKECEGRLLKVKGSGICVAPADLLKEVGGWRDLQHNENWDVCERAARKGKYVWTIFKVKEEIGPERDASFVTRNRLRFRWYLDELRLGRSPSQLEKRVGIERKVDFGLAQVAVLFMGRLNGATDFDSSSSKTFVDSSRWWHTAGADESEEARWYAKLLKRNPGWGQESDPD